MMTTNCFEKPEDLCKVFIIWSMPTYFIWRQGVPMSNPKQVKATEKRKWKYLVKGLYKKLLIKGPTAGAFESYWKFVQNHEKAINTIWDLSTTERKNERPKTWLTEKLTHLQIPLSITLSSDYKNMLPPLAIPCENQSDRSNNIPYRP